MRTIAHHFPGNGHVVDHSAHAPGTFSRTSVTGTRRPEPFFSRRPANDSSRSLLLLSYHFAPSRAVGALRWQRLAAFAAQRGYRLDVVTLDPASVAQRDEQRLEDLPPGTRIFGVAAPQSRVQNAVSGVLAARRWVVKTLRSASGDTHASSTTTTRTPRRDSFAWSEVRPVPLSARDLDRLYSSWLDYALMGAWATDVAETALALASVERYSAVITCGPPHMIHEAGRRVARETGLPLVLDFRDPWSLVQRVPDALASPLWLRYAKRYERSAVGAASLVVVNTEVHCAALRKRYPELAAPIITVTNGYDDDAVRSNAVRRQFVAAYAGTVYLDRDPRPFFRASARLIRERSLSRDDFALAFMGTGTLDGLSLQELARSEGVEDYVDVRPSGPRREALEFLAGATMLVSLPQDSDMAIPSKVFEYMQYNAWLLALAAPGSATALLLDGTTADVIEPNNEEALYRVLDQRYEQHVRGVVPPRIADDRRFSRERQASILFDAMEAMLAPNKRGVPELRASEAVAAPLS